MVVLIIIAVLIGFGIRAYIGYIGKSKMTKADGDITTMQAALDAYYSTNQNYPQSQSALTMAGVSSYLVATVSATIPTGSLPYNYYPVSASTYKIFTITSVNGNYMEGIGTNGTSTSATLTPSL